MSMIKQAIQILTAAALGAVIGVFPSGSMAQTFAGMPAMIQSCSNGVTSTPTPTTVAVGANITVTNSCALAPNASSGSIVYGSAASNAYAGYGGNISLPGNSTSITRDMNTINNLSLNWVRLDYGSPFRVNSTANMPGPVGVTDAQMYTTVYQAMYNWITQNPSTTISNNPTTTFYHQLKAKGVKVVSVMFNIPENYRTSSVDPTTGNTVWVMNKTLIPDFAQFLVAYYLSLNALGIPPDYVELVNEPDGNWSVQFGASSYADFAMLVNQDLTQCQSYTGQLTTQSCPSIGILGPGTSNIKPAGNFLPSLTSAGAVADMAGLSTHIYFVPPDSSAGVNTIYNSISPTYNPVYAQMAAAAQAANKNLIITEFGGRLDDTSSTSNPTLLLKGALDLIRQGASAGLIWDILDGSSVDLYALINSDGTPTPSYFAVQALVPNIPAGASPLQATSTNIGQYMASPGFGAFGLGDQVVFGLANPSSTAVQITVDFSGAQNLNLNTAYSYTDSQVISVPLNLVRSTCPITFNLGAFSGVVVLGQK
jgi:hypothetical protein